MDNLEKIDNNAISVIENDEFKKANSLISAKYKSTLVENKLLALALSRADSMIAEEVKIDGNITTVYTSVLKSSEISEELNISKKNLTSQLTAAYLKMQSRQIGVENDNGDFGYRSLVIGADYVNGVFKLYFNPLLGNYYREISKNYTFLSRKTLMSFKSVHSFRLYELLKEECYNTNKKTKIIEEAHTMVYEIEYSLAELKLMLGVINADSQVVRDILTQTGKKGTPDYEKAIEAAPEKGFEDWSEFRRKCIVNAVKEINEKTEMKIDYSLKKAGKGGKVYAIVFIVEVPKKNEAIKEDVNNSTQKNVSEEDRIAFIDEIMDLIEERIKVKEAHAIAEASDYNMDKVKKAYKFVKSKPNVTNFVGYMVSAIKEDYENTSFVNKAGAFGKFKQRDIDFDELEAKIYAN